MSRFRLISLKDFLTHARREHLSPGFCDTFADRVTFRLIIP